MLAADGALALLQVKERMIRDTVLLVDPLPFDRDALVEVLRRRLTKAGHGQCRGRAEDRRS